MRLKHVVQWILILVITGVSLLAAWTLRQPIQFSWSYLQRTTTPQPVVRFAVIGDNHGDNEIFRLALKKIAHEPVAFLVNLADVSDGGTAQEFSAVRRLEQPLPFPVYHTVGNHDIKTDPSRRLFEHIFDQAANASFDQKQVHLVILDNADRKVGFSQTTLDWLSADLARHQNQTIILAYHRPFDLPLAQVIGDDETTASRASDTKFLDIISHYHIAYILTAHIHTYLQYAVNGIPAVVSGGGGDPAQAILGGPANNFFHYLVVTVKGKAVSVELHRLQLEN